jgi:hypothetical protein
MIIWGSKGRETTIGEGEFLCPTCRRPRHYKHKKVARYFTLYFIPLFQTKALGEYVECQACKTPFKPEVLHITEAANQEIRAQREASLIVGELSKQLEAGLSLDVVVSKLKNHGIEEKAALRALMLATGGRVSFCDTCGITYKATLAYCSRCGRPLKPMPNYFGTSDA